jgi:L-alanine-DL-glutamate epimerase-like enolase superfamily enzyme
LLLQGFRTLKVKVGFDAGEDAKRLREIQLRVAGRASIRVDANQGYTQEAALRFAAGIDPEGIELLEQPCRAGDWDAACAVARASTVPMMLDESIYGLQDIRRAAELGAARFIKVKLMKLGSLRRLAEAIELIRALDMEPVLGNGVACEIGCWMEALVARTGIRNAGEMNGYLKQSVPLLANPPRFSAGAMQLEPAYKPELDHSAIARLARDSVEYSTSGIATT